MVFQVKCNLLYMCNSASEIGEASSTSNSACRSHKMMKRKNVTTWIDYISLLSALTAVLRLSVVTLEVA